MLQQPTVLVSGAITNKHLNGGEAWVRLTMTRQTSWVVRIPPAMKLIVPERLEHAPQIRVVRAG